MEGLYGDFKMEKEVALEVSSPNLDVWNLLQIESVFLEGPQNSPSKKTKDDAIIKLKIKPPM